MNESRVAPYGSWRSPITSELIASANVGLGQIALDGADVYWAESRPSEGGRIVVLHRTPDGEAIDAIPPPFNARTRVHEYGGGAFAVADGTVHFANFADQRLYRVRPGEDPQPITAEADMRYADLVVDRGRQRLICVREDHSAADREAVNTIAAVPLPPPDGKEPALTPTLSQREREPSPPPAQGTEARFPPSAQAAENPSPPPSRGRVREGGASAVLVGGNDFYSSPRLSPDGTRLAWLTWNHPNMPWDGTELWVGEVKADGSVGSAERVAGGVDESIFQPEWSPDGVLYFISDRTGWWNLYRWKEGRIEAICKRDAEFGVPQWVFGLSTYGFESDEQLICTFGEQGRSRLAALDTRSLQLHLIELPYTSIGGLRVAPGRAAFVGGASTEPSAIVRLDLAMGHREVLRRASELTVDAGYLSTPEAIEFPTEDGLTARAFFYQPRNRDFAAPPGERPPLLVMSHGGPTSATSTALRLSIQYWTSRGIAVLDVNYGGSTGYGRAYRRRLDGRWGIVDVDDCVNGARYLVQRGEVDGERLAITGGSAGGYTTLAALTFRDLFKAGASYYGVSDLEALARDTHKFESRYLDRLVGPYPERRDLYVERSPINFPERLSRPTIFFQGLEDKIVPPNQAEMMAEALRHKGVPVAYLPFEGEQHGFRRAENIKRALDAELYFYSRLFAFEPADSIEPVPIENLQAR